MDDNLKVTEIRIVVEGGSLDSIRDKESLEAGVAMTQGSSRTIHVTEAVGKGVTYDLIGKLVTATGLIRRTVVEIMKGIKSETFHLYRLNPEEFIIKAGMIDYQRLQGACRYPVYQVRETERQVLYRHLHREHAAWQVGHQRH